MRKTLASAVQDFHHARLRAQLENIVASLTGRSAELLPYEEVRNKLRARERSSRQLQDIPVDAIVGSVGRYRDFTRSFLPKKETAKDRWARIEVAMTGMESMPPIEVYKIADACFVRDLVTQFSQSPARRIGRIGRRVVEAITPDELEVGPPAGRWREERVIPRQNDRLFTSILVPIRGDASGWSALDQALMVARREEACLRGIHVVAAEEQQEDPETLSIRSVFERRCSEAGVEGSMVFAVVSVHRNICRRARWVDLVVTSLDHPPGLRPMSKIGSGMVSLVRRCPRPVLVVPTEASSFEHALLAYDGTPKAREALFVATYISGSWRASLTVASVAEGRRVSAQTLEEARAYLTLHGIDAQYELFGSSDGAGEADALLSLANDAGCDSIFIGGYSSGPVVEAMLGSTVDRMMRETARPMLICR